MTANNYKHIITNDRLWIRQLFLKFLSTVNVTPVVFNISSSHANTNSPKTRSLA